MVNFAGHLLDYCTNLYSGKAAIKMPDSTESCKLVKLLDVRDRSNFLTVTEVRWTVLGSFVLNRR